MLLDQEHSSRKLIAEREAKVRNAGERLAEHLGSQVTPTLFLDMDGVVFCADGLRYPRITDYGVLSALISLESLGVQIGPATGRGLHVVQTLRDYGLQIQGPGIFEEGQMYVTNGEIHQFGHPNHPAFMNTLREAMTKHPDFVPTWDHVRPDTNAISPGNPQWQGRNRFSYWFSYDDNQERDSVIVSSIRPFVEASADQHGLHPDNDIALTVYRMKPHKLNGNVAIVGIKGRHNGRDIDKGTAAHMITTPRSWSFVADGFGDTPLANVTHSRGGVVIGIEGNLDMTNDASIFLARAHARLRDPREFAGALRHTASVLRGKRMR